MEEVGGVATETQEENVGLVSEGANKLTLWSRVAQVLHKHLEPFLAENLPVAASPEVIVTRRAGQS